MYNKTRIIVLHKTNYSENSIVVQALALDYGKISFLVSGVKGKKSKIGIALFEPLSILDIVANFKDVEKLIRPKEIKLNTPYFDIRSNMGKRMIVLFLSELLNRCIKEPHPEKELFLFVENALKYLEITRESVANFHLVFLKELSRYLGFQPHLKSGYYFDMQEGVFTDVLPQSSAYLEGEKKDMFASLLGTKIDKCNTLNFNSSDRKMILDALIRYYQIHIPGLTNLKSQGVLEALFV